MTARTTATTTYCHGSGCALTSPGSRLGAACAMRYARSPWGRSASWPLPCSISCVSVSLTLASFRQQVDDGEDHDPDDVDEVPVQPGDLHPLGVALRDATLHRETPQRDQPHDPDEHVGAVDAGEDEEARTEQVGVDVEALAGELGELEDLAADERRPEERGGHDPHPEAPVVAPLHRSQREHHGEAAHQQYAGGHGGEGHVGDVPRRRAGLPGAVAIEQVGGDER